MRGILKEETGRALKGKGMLLALAIGCTIAAVHVIQYQIPAYQANQTMTFDRKLVYPNVVSSTWLAGNTFNLESFLYFLVLPLIAALPFGTTYFTDQKEGYLKSIYMRVSRKQYLRAKYTAAFLSGGVAVVIPLVLNLMCCMVLVPNLPSPSIMPQNGICARNVFYEIYYSKPTAYILIFLCLDFLLGGIYACIALAGSFLADYKIIVAAAPFFVQLTVHVICSMSDKIQWSSVYFAQSGYGLRSLVIPFVYIVAGISVTAGLFLYKGEREDVF